MSLRDRFRFELPRSRRFGWITLALALVTLMGGLTQSPHFLRRMDTFRVQQVEVRGTRYLAPDEVLEASGIGEQSSVFDATERWLGPLERHPMIDSARIERRLPGTVRIIIAEKPPVALVRAATLLPVDRLGRVLPIAPEQAHFDLPILIGEVRIDERGLVAEPAARAAIAAMARMQAREPTLAAAVSEFAGGDALRLVLRVGGPALALLPVEATDTRLAQLRRTLEDLAGRGELSHTRVVDGRFEGQVVVSMNTASSS